MLNPLAAPQPFENPGFFLNAIRWNENQDGLANGFRRSVAKEPLCTRVPARDNPIEILADYCIVGGIDDGTQKGGCARCLFALVDVDYGANEPANLPSGSNRGRPELSAQRNSPLARRNRKSIE